MPAGVKFASVSAGANFSCAMSTDKNIYCWGKGSEVIDAATPTQVNIPAGLSFSRIETGDNHICALNSDKTAYCWGNGSSGKLGNGASHSSTVPVQVKMPATVVDSVDLNPVNVSDNDPLKKFEYSLGTIYPGERIQVEFSGKFRRGSASRIIGNQAYFTSDETSLTGLNGGDLPNDMIVPTNSSDAWKPGIEGNATCNTDATSQNPEDLCDQVPGWVYRYNDPLGAISGQVWQDANQDGLRQTTEAKVEQVKVILLDQNDAVVGETFSDSNGQYSFTDLSIGDYKVRFEALGLTAPNGKKYGFTTQDADPNGATSDQDSDADNSGLTNSVTVTANNTREHVDAGLVTVNANITVDKTSDLGDPATLPLNNQGLTDELTINITVTNNGEEPLTDFKIEDQTLTGVDITNLTCTYNGAAITPTTVIPVGGVVNCTAILPSFNAGAVHEDKITTTATGTISQTTVQAEDNFKAESAAPKPSITITKYVVTGPNPDTNPNHRVDANDFNNPVVVNTTKPKFIYIVTNNGNVKLSNVRVTAPKPNQVITCPKTSLLVNESMVCAVTAETLYNTDTYPTLGKVTALYKPLGGAPSGVQADDLAHVKTNQITSPPKGENPTNPNTGVGKSNRLVLWMAVGLISIGLITRKKYRLNN